MSRNIERIIALTEILRRHLPIIEPFAQQLSRKFRLEFSFNSTHIEGGTLSLDEVALALLYGRGKGDHTLQEYDEVRGNDVAYDRIQELIEQGYPLTEVFIRDLNGLILVRPFLKNAKTADGKAAAKTVKPGVYKETPNSVLQPNGELHYYASPEETPRLMGDLMQWYREEGDAGQLHPVEIAARWHYEFVKIHPFDDGNGRIARLIMNYILLKNGLPAVIIKSADKTNYLAALQDADLGRIESFVDYIATQLIWSLEISIRAAKGQSVDELGDFEKKVAALKKYTGEPSKEPIVKKSPLSIMKAIEGSVIPFAKAWERKIKELDSFFFSRETWIDIDGKRRRGPDFDAAMELVSAHLSQATPSGTLPISQIMLYCAPRGLRNVNKDMGLNGGKATFYFHDHIYEIESSEVDIKQTKLYNDFFTPEELEAKAEKMATFLLDIITRSLGASERPTDAYLPFNKKVDCVEGDKK
jgi:Fic family protein